MERTRKQYIEEIMEHTHAIRRKMSSEWPRSKDSKDITSSQWRALLAVSRKENLSVTELADMLNVTSSAATQLVNELVDKHFLVRKDKVDDRRTLVLSLSDGVRKKINNMKSKQMDKFQHIFDALTDKELEKYVELNKKISEHFQPNHD